MSQARNARGGRSRRADPPIGLMLGGLAALIVVGAIAVNALTSRSLPGESFPSQGNAHVQSPSARTQEYNSSPPTSGQHLPNLAPWGRHSTPQTPEALVHNMEDGGVVLYYDPARVGVPEVDELERLVTEAENGRYNRIVITPLQGLESRFAATAWTRLLRFEDLEQGEEELLGFLEAFHGVDHHPRN